MSNSLFRLHSPFPPTGDQPEAINALVKGIKEGKRFQVLEGVTGSGKTFTIANVIAAIDKPVLIVSHNKTLAAQLFSELKFFFPENAVEYFISYYDYYQPEAYIPQTDTYIEKDSSINKEIEKYRLAATNSLLCRRDVIIVASVSCIYGLGSPEDYYEMVVHLKAGELVERDEVLHKLVDIQYTRNDISPESGTFRVRGDTVEIFPSYSNEGIRVDFFGDQVEKIQITDPLTGKAKTKVHDIFISPAKHFVMPEKKIKPAIQRILEELEARVKWFEDNAKFLEAQRIKQRTMYDIEMLQEIGYCAGIENYSRHLSGRREGEPPATLIDYFRDDFLVVIDESHATIPQLRAMYNGDQSRKNTLIEHGFRLPSAKDNRPLSFDEFMARVKQGVFLSATPGQYELSLCDRPVHQLIRPTGLLDPEIEVRPLKGQVDDVMKEIRLHARKHERVIVTTLTKKTAEDLAAYLRDAGLKVEHIHSEIEALERVKILNRLRRGDFDCIVGINLLREGLDLPEVALVAILDADKEGFLRSETSLIQIAGRTARHINGKVILYADAVTQSMKRLIEVTEERRRIQQEYNKKHGITPKSIVKSIRMESFVLKKETERLNGGIIKEEGKDYDVHLVMEEIKREMLEACLLYTSPSPRDS